MTLKLFIVLVVVPIIGNSIQVSEASAVLDNRHNSEEEEVRRADRLSHQRLVLPREARRGQPHRADGERHKESLVHHRPPAGEHLPRQEHEPETPEKLCGLDRRQHPSQAEPGQQPAHPQPLQAQP